MRELMQMRKRGDFKKYPRRKADFFLKLLHLPCQGAFLMSPLSGCFSLCDVSLRCRLSGGNANNGAAAGAGASNANNAWSNTNANVSAPLHFVNTRSRRERPCRLAEDNLAKRIPVGFYKFDGFPQRKADTSQTRKPTHNMKRYGNLYEHVCSYETLVQASQNARRGKNRQHTVREFYSDFEKNILKLQEELLTHTFKTSEYSVFTVYEPKERIIYKLPFRDRVVHWAIMLIVGEIWTAHFTRDTYSCIKGRGIHAVVRKLKSDLTSDPVGTAYCLKIDIRKFYPSIDHAILKHIIAKKIKDAELLNLLAEIIDSVPPNKGIPIGNYLSQFFANLYLTELDHLLKEVYHVRYYYRYADDIVLLGTSKGELHGLLVAINHYLNNDRNLNLKSNYQVYPVAGRGIDFVGYIFYHTHILARKKNKQGLARTVFKLRRQGIDENAIRIEVASRTGFMLHCNSIHLLKSLNLNVVGMKKFSEVSKGKGKLEGSKLHIDQILDKPLRLLAYEITDSKHNADKCLTVQYEIEENVKGEDGNVKTEWVKHITFTGSKALVSQLQDVESGDFPFCVKIIKQPIGEGGRKCFYKLIDPD
ncbi:hypothetical protein EZS27_001358 [termite gut metagenome]|uniref:Reverse transcriptase domain-containing protein n=1 Tax=termite gut metagenome TaxID=433724 RepID=A0A5J4SZT1_9ZZZZ